MDDSGANHAQERPRVFISHASANLKAAQQLSAALEGAGFDPWLDRSDIRVGALLRKQLQEAIEASRAAVLLWSKPAAASRWVAAEILTAFHLNRFIIPCLLSQADLPQFLARAVHFDLRRNRKEALARLGAQVRDAPRSRNEFTGIRSYETEALRVAIQQIDAAQRKELDCVGNDPAKALRLHAATDTLMRKAESRWRYDPTILNLAGYHRKNQYMLSHWEEYCAGRFPKDPVLEEGERFFFDTLFVNPIDYSALNGLGNILLFEGELDAAEFFVRRAIEEAERDGVDYTDAKHDLGVILNRARAPELGRPPGARPRSRDAAGTRGHRGEERRGKRSAGMRQGRRAGGGG